MNSNTYYKSYGKQYEIPDDATVTFLMDGGRLDVEVLDGRVISVLASGPLLVHPKSENCVWLEVE